MQNVEKLMGLLLAMRAHAGRDGIPSVPRSLADDIMRWLDENALELIDRAGLEDRDAKRYNRLRILGAQTQGNGSNKLTPLLCFQNLDDFVDQDLRNYPSRGEAKVIMVMSPIVKREAYVQGFVEGRGATLPPAILKACAEADEAYVRWQKSRGGIDERGLFQIAGGP